MANADTSDYVMQLTKAAQLVAQGVADAEQRSVRAWELVYQSRSGAPHVPWLEPAISDHLISLAKDGATSACVIPIGFISDHLEVLWDLDTQAQATAAECGITMVRAATVGTDPLFVSAIADMIEAGINNGSIETCPVDCCPAPTRR
jgi:ferrochelatase